MTGDPIVVAARFLSTQLEWARHRDEDEIKPLLSEIDRCARVLRSLVRGPQESRYLGVCGYEHATELQPGITRIDPCPGDVYARVHRDGSTARTGTCRTCGATVDTDARRAWLDGEVRAHAFSARDIADAYGLNVKTIRSWAARGLSTGLLRSYWRTDAGIVADWVEPPEGVHRERLHYVGDVLDMAVAEKARQAEAQAKRARRREQATTQGDAA